MAPRSMGVHESAARRQRIRWPSGQAGALGVVSLLRPSGDTPSASARAHELVADGARLLDVRTPEEFAGGHVDGAVNLPVQDLAAKLATLADKKDKDIVVYCRSGRRSASAKQTLVGAGFKKVHDLGGIGNW